MSIGISQTEKELGILIAIARNNAVGATVVEGVFAVEIEIIVLIKAGAADINTELVSVIAFHPGQTIGPLKTVPHLWQEALKVVAEGCAAVNVDVRNSGKAGGQPGRDAQIGGGAELTRNR